MYTLNISGHQVTVPNEIKALIKESMAKLSRYNDKITSVNVTFNLTKQETDKVQAEATIRIPGKEFFATSEADNSMSVTVDSLVQKLEKQLRRYKNKTKSKSSERFAEDTSIEDMQQEEFNALVDRGIEVELVSSVA
ncbi:ribosome hibernation-promoting factor, HPF/YfiA family [Marinicellulosiphila megalodicopiae]|uniref:ribosome hibernation-promoting factor, HPF/YfiA family n=1 Tax=Marinicellulosiphila megalodicopiae TaxID=2724896 RepID=UPI003BAEB645